MAARASGVDDEIRELYQGPLAGFVAARQALAKKLKGAGDERAAEVRELRKPSLSAWAVNALFAAEPKAMAELIGAGGKARAETERKSPDARALRDLLTQVRAATSAWRESPSFLSRLASACRAVTKSANGPW